MKRETRVVSEGESIRLYVPADVRDALELDETVAVAIVVECVESTPALSVLIEPTETSPGARRSLVKGSNEQYRLTLPPALCRALELVDVDVVIEPTDGGFSIRRGG